MAARLILGGMAALCLSACEGRFCDPGRAVACATGNGDEGARICQDGSGYSECFRLEPCNPLTQEGCRAGTYCFPATGTNLEGGGTFCAPADVYPCSPGQHAKFDSNGEVVCRGFCNLDQCLDTDDCMDPENCRDFERCSLGGTPVPEGVGECWCECGNE